MNAVVSENTRAVRDIEAWELYPGTHILGNRTLDRYATVPSKSVPVVLKAIQFMDGRNSLDEIASYLRADGYLLDMHQLQARLWKAGLVEGAPYQGDVTRLSTCWFSAPVASVFRLIPQSLNFLASLTAVCGLVLCIAVWLALKQGLNPASYLGMRSYAGLVPSAIALFIGVTLSVIAHEGAHGVIASSLGRPPSRVRGLAYLGFIPCVVLTIPGIYTLPAKQRIAIWIAGPFGSLLAAASAILLDSVARFGSVPHVWMGQFAAINLGIALYNFCPLLPTDGYFVLSTFLRQPNMRSRSWRELGNLFRGVSSPSAPLLIYGFVFVAFTTVVIARNIRLLLASTAYSFAGYLIVAVLGIAVCAKLFLSAEAGRK